MILDSSAVDSDVNEPLSPPIANNDFATAQPLRSPTLVGGYVNNPGTGQTGNSFDGGDVSDFYQVDLDGTETLILSIANGDSDDLDLFLYDNGQMLLDASVGFGETESVAAPAAGTFFVEIRAIGTTSASNYVLSIGRNSVAGAARACACRTPS